jgi:predicted Zn-dependent peptidase
LKSNIRTAGRDLSQFKKTGLKNGIRVVSESHSDVKGVAMGLWVLTGTRDEASNQVGVSHFLEHMVFKGTKTRSAYQIAKALEELGGDLNAYTTREYTCYHTLVLKDHWKQSLEVLADLASNMSYSRGDFSTEKSVILQEIAMSDDNLDEVIYDYYFEAAYKGTTMARPILGDLASIMKMGSKDLLSYYKSRYTGDRIIISASGDLEHAELVAETQRLLGKKLKSNKPSVRRKPKHRSFREVREKSSEQVHILLGMPAASFRDDHRFEAFIVNTLLGGGMTSKLYQSVRERRGLVYSIHSSLNTFTDFGLLTIHAATDLQKVKEVVKLVGVELRKLKREGIKKSDLKLFKTQVIGSILLGSEDMENRMTSLGVNEMVFAKYKPVEEIIAELEAVSVESVNEYLKTSLDVDAMGGLLMGGGVSQLDAWWQSVEI